ncbi:glutamate--tRNA ligase [Candidatus Wolfebacteria bacterium RIFCSPHIGHO2_01_FULL_48_22]|uniref:Glutamate--tRNA ligase n=2 Tax=Candidatus Wolfeibacteriota TaxID=1752735 RepID=A0A1F8DT92_9BACT|nr:MAG: glutamate--tRNA ligase [Candidatus Wolfebacteria bacterium RIFCSPHIGHO2_01_FULL_48_22]OGM92651.1 MAG: glutamate--tRNA ligase [Candidatus Wolfebacteria bacterium RIFCSPLOWO2_01_FULL_47_17b]
MASEQPIRVRIAPSPTGYLHLGTVRTALYNYLFAKKEKGAFVLRIEDTDQSRSLPLYEQDILEGLQALGLTWDEGPDIGGSHGPYRQSERTKQYTERLQALVRGGKAYKCFCTKEQLDEERKGMIAAGLAPKYSGTCRNLTAEQVAQYEKDGKESVLRIKVPLDYEVEFSDLIRGKISINSSTIGDFIIAKDETSPLYNFAVVVDDADMRISHVIRGEDHISNTPKQILIQQALGFPEVVYAHLPLILSPDRSKLSKRSLETAFIEYLKDGYLPEALLNFIVLLGWHPEGDEELLTLEEMIQRFSIKRVQKAGAVFNMEKLDWFNAQYIRRLSEQELVKRMEGFVPEAWLARPEVLTKALIIERERIQKLSDFRENAGFFFEIGEYETDLLRWQDMPLEKVALHMRHVRELVAAGKDGDIMPYAEQEGRGEVLWPLRVALSGLRNSPGPFEIMYVLGKNESLKRIDAAIQKIIDGQDHT